MTVPSAVRNQYSAVAAQLNSLENYVSSTIRPWAERHKYPFLGRKKTLPSVSEKLESGRYKSWDEIDDLYACTIVIPTSGHSESVKDFLAAKFDVVQVKGRDTSKKAPEIFRFDTTRWVGRIRKDSAPTGLPRGTEDILFEVQIPTVFEHAWAVATHDIAYKANSADWRTSRISALLKASIEQIELIIDGFQSSADFVSVSEDPRTDAINAFVLEARKIVERGDISRELEPESWSRFGQNVYSLVESYSSRYAAPAKLREITERLYSWVQSQEDLHEIRGGSLFQIIVRMVATGGAPGGSIGKFPVVSSSELHDIHQISDIPCSVSIQPAPE
ncbi:hypothetical protein GCM10027068_46180 [Prescottella soli]